MRTFLNSILLTLVLSGCAFKNLAIPTQPFVAWGTRVDNRQTNWSFSIINDNVSLYLRKDPPVLQTFKLLDIYTDQGSIIFRCRGEDGLILAEYKPEYTGPTIMVYYWQEGGGIRLVRLEQWINKR